MSIVVLSEQPYSDVVTTSTVLVTGSPELFMNMCLEVFIPGTTGVPSP